ncbi:M14 family metallopeptidase [Anditalea andensis]|uniref:Zinc carboxypeptidase n=1 Tax=Anditalea andensis TaxID=1048983 RepID=A0A074L1E7_9BACT|nr:M14 family metallopeptidase [Anditalea andensis]KEO73653.1 zinc carboxypeptidase [Anditalea andensis]
MKKLLLSILLLSFIVHVQGQTKSPAEFLGYELGDRFTPHHKIVAYFEHVAQNNRNVVLEQYGESYELRPLVLAFVSSQTNIENINQIREDNLKRTGYLDGSPANNIAINWMSYNVHGNEAVSSEASMWTLWELINPDNHNTKVWLENTMVILDPCINPDGRDRYAMWYNQKMNTRMQPDRQSMEHNEPWPGGRPNHYLFDLNRDWAWQTQKESEARIKVYNQWMPQVHTDFHEQGIDSPYYFPPAAEPLHKQLTPYQHEFQNLVGRNIAKYFDQENWFYFTKERFDLLYPSYGDSWPMYNGAIGMTIEQGGSGRAGIGVLTAEGDTLTLKDRIAHHHTTGLAITEVTSKNVDNLLKEFTNYFKDNRQAPRGNYKSFVIKNAEGHGNLESLLDLLDKNGIQYGAAAKKTNLRGFDYQSGKTASFSTDEKDIIISASQPKSVLAQILFEPSPILADSITYDITSWALPYAYGVQAYAMESNVEPAGIYIRKPFEENKIEGKPLAYIAPWSNTNHAAYLSALLNDKIRVRYAAYPFEFGNEKYPSGSILITRRGNENIVDFDAKVIALANKHKIGLKAAQTAFVDKGKDFGSPDVHYIKPPKVALVGGQGISSLNFGEIWHFMEQELDYPLSIFEKDQLTQIDLQDYNVIILPAGNYNSLTDATNKKLQEWVRAGGKLIAMESALSLFNEKEGYALKAYSNEEEKKAQEKQNEDMAKAAQTSPFQQEERRNISTNVAGAIYQVKLDTTHPLAYGMNENYYTLKNNNNRYAYLMNGQNVGIIPTSDNYRTGFIGYQVKPMMAQSLIFGVDTLGKGQVIYMVDNPSFRNFWQNGKLIMANALFLVGQ